MTGTVPLSLPFMSRPHAALELRVWALMAVPMGMLSGGVSGVLLNTVFAGGAAAWLLSLAVAVATGSGPLGNVSSVVWSHVARGRDKVGVLTALQTALGGCLLVAAAVPLTTAGLVVLTAAIVAAQVLWCGMITVRASVWRANYTREARTAFAARSQIFVSLTMAAAGAGAGLALDLDGVSFRWVFAAAALATFTSLLTLRRLRVRRHRQLLAAETGTGARRGFDPTVFRSILRDDGLYRRYLAWMMVLGSGNLMLTAPLILVLHNELGLGSLSQVLLTASLPMLIMPVAIPFWARALAGRHVIAFRSLNSRLYAGASGLIVAGALTGVTALLWAGAVLLGIGAGGGTLGWNLGHNDFAPPEKVADYLGLHVTLTGLRGLVAPLVGVGLYAAIERAAPGAGAWALLLPFALTTAGAIGFARMNRRTGDRAWAG